MQLINCNLIQVKIFRLKAEKNVLCYPCLFFFHRSRSLRTPANMFIINLSVSDFLMSVTQCPVFFTSSLNKRWTFGEKGTYHCILINDLDLTTWPELCNRHDQNPIWLVGGRANIPSSHCQAYLRHLSDYHAFPLFLLHKIQTKGTFWDNSSC